MFTLQGAGSKETSQFVNVVFFPPLAFLVVNWKQIHKFANKLFVPGQCPGTAQELTFPLHLGPMQSKLTSSAIFRVAPGVTKTRSATLQS